MSTRVALSFWQRWKWNSYWHDYVGSLFQILFSARSLQNDWYKKQYRLFLCVETRLTFLTSDSSFTSLLRLNTMFGLLQYPGTLSMLTGFSKRMTNDYRIVLVSSLSTLGRVLSEHVDLSTSDLCTLLKLCFTNSAYASHHVKINFPWSLVTINLFFFSFGREWSETALNTSAFCTPFCLYFSQINTSIKLCLSLSSNVDVGISSLFCLVPW